MLIYLEDETVNFLIMCNTCPYNRICGIGEQFNEVINHTVENPNHVISIQVNSPEFTAELLQESIESFKPA